MNIHVLTACDVTRASPVIDVRRDFPHESSLVGEVTGLPQLLKSQGIFQLNFEPWTLGHCATHHER